MIETVSFILFLVAVIGIGRVVREAAISPMPIPRERPLEITPTSVAWLAGGARRLADTWWALLTQAGYLCPSADKKNIRIQSSASIAHLDADTQRAARALARHIHRRPDQILLDWEEAIKQSRSIVEVSGGFHDTKEIKRRRHLMINYFVIAALGFLAGWLFLGWWLWVCGLSIFGVGIFVVMTPNQERLTAHGEAMLLEVQDVYRHAILAPQADTLGFAVALIGPAVLAGTPWSGLASPSKAKDSDSSGGCGTVVSSWGCGSSDGGSGCGGGGCGD